MTTGQVTLRGIKRVQDLVRDFERSGIDTMPVFRGIGARMRRIQIGHFDAKKNLDGSAWPPLSEVTKSKPGRGGDSARPLRHHDLMFTSITYKATKKYAVVGTNDPKAEYHQDGSEDGKHLPMRQFIYITEEDTDFLVNVLTDRLVRDPIERA